jgi:hypothetical protein
MFLMLLMFLMLRMIQPLTACSRSRGGQVEAGKLRAPADHELPRGFPAGGFAMSTRGIKERQDGKPPQTWRHYEGVTPPRPWSRASGDVACAAWAKIGMATNPTAVMLVDLRGKQASA